MEQKVRFNKFAGKARRAFHNSYLKLMNMVEPINPVVMNPEMLTYLEENYFSKGKSVNFIANHTNSHDIPVAAKAVKEHFYVFISKEGLTLIQKIAFFLNGPIWIKRNDSKSRAQSQMRLTEASKNGYSTLTYPEASWNTTPNKFMNKFFLGILRSSKESNTDIVPLVFEYIDDDCYVKIGKPYLVDKNKDLRLQADELRDMMTTTRVEILEEEIVFSPRKSILNQIEYMADNWDLYPDWKFDELMRLRKELINLKEKEQEEFNKTIEKNWQECPGLDRNFEASCVYKDEDSPDEVFAHLDTLKGNSKAKFLFKEGISGYKK